MNYEHFKKLFKFAFIQCNFLYIVGDSIACKIPLKYKNIIFENAEITDGTMGDFLSESNISRRSKRSKRNRGKGSRSRSNKKEIMKKTVINIFSDISEIPVEDTYIRNQNNYILDTGDILVQFQEKYVEAAKQLLGIGDSFLEDVFYKINYFINGNCYYSLCIETIADKSIQVQILPVLFDYHMFGKSKKFLTVDLLKKINKNKKMKVSVGAEAIE